MAFKAWICERCRSHRKSSDEIWDCPGCGKECYESCFDRYAHCRVCADGKSDEELRLAANAAGYDFQPVEASR